MMTADAHPVIAVVDQVGTPWLAIVVRCSRCHAELCSHRFDARTDREATVQRYADAHAAAWEAHRCLGH